LAPRPSLLIVENDQAVREAVAMALTHLGYEIVLAASGSGEEALQILAEVAALDGLYTDIELSGKVNGWVVGQTFSVLWPSKPIVYASGAAREPKGSLAAGVFLRKPFDVAALEGVFSPEGTRRGSP
jgi:CheY-like chemotaxis protein